MTSYTPNFELPEYEGTDKPDLTDQYNQALNLIDTALQDGVAERTELQNSIVTLNTNLSATNTNVSNLSAKLDTFDGRITANANGLQTLSGEISNVEANVADLQTSLGTQQTVTATHTGYFTALGVTDAQSANDLHTQIDNSYQGVMSNTQSIGDINEQVLSINEDMQNTETFNATNLSSYLTELHNANLSQLKFSGIYTPAAGDTWAQVPSLGKYGYKIKQADAIWSPIYNQGTRNFVCAVMYRYSTSGLVDFITWGSVALGSDGYWYMTSPASEFNSATPPSRSFTWLFTQGLINTGYHLETSNE